MAKGRGMALAFIQGKPGRARARVFRAVRRIAGGCARRVASTCGVKGWAVWYSTVWHALSPQPGRMCSLSFLQADSSSLSPGCQPVDGGGNFKLQKGV